VAEKEPLALPVLVMMAPEKLFANYYNRFSIMATFFTSNFQ
jgi:hypothetical protein